MANPEHVELAKQGAEAIAKWREENPDVTLDLGRADLAGADLMWANLSEANLSEANLSEADLSRANLSRANLAKALLTEADLSEVNLSEANLHNASLAGASLAKANLYRATLTSVRQAHRAYGLATVELRTTDDTHADYTNDVRDFWIAFYPWIGRLSDWEHLKIIGRLPLFGMSYTVLILIPVVFYGLALYNDRVDLVRAWAEQLIALPDHPWHRLAPLVLERLHPRPVPSLSLILLGSTVLLAIASTLYTFFCPSRIKEFSRDQWCDQIGRSLLHYWPLAWKYRYIRLICAACYALGGAGALWVLSTKVWHTAVFIWDNSTWSWW